MNRRGFLAGLTAGLAGSTITTGAARAQAAASPPMLERLTLFVPTSLGGGAARCATAIGEVLRAESLVGQLDTVYAPAETSAALVRFLELGRGPDDVIMVTGASLIGAGILQRAPLELVLGAPIARIACEHLVLAVAWNSDIDTLKELTIGLQLEPATIRFAGGPRGGTEHLLVADLARQAGIEPQRLAYVSRPPGETTGAQIFSGQANCAVGGLSELQLDISLGRLRGLAISSSQRLPGVNIPTFGEMGVDLRMDNWRGIFAPPESSPEQRERLAGLIARLVRTPSWRAKLFQHNWMSAYLPMPAFGDFVTTNIAQTRRQLAEFGLS
ncbi:tripartite tricarboxylate transporter substrate-binding protein [Ancylobacter sp. SL191]|uniref:tripartite tricarboxylate transporter substrate-binding protein n=1 Tax=Ancylobacter sp. SL191 TaxID=2995166 RepID=UPI00226E40CD|nr:tripartite tricarboxylate transporter substrate-binding protein [Ancylobacter sp. SL191]WAC28441.1 tripartite tricarboxylate transporter substrate-binding protein [Ancylobacter sp. SL191]